MGHQNAKPKDTANFSSVAPSLIRRALPWVLLIVGAFIVLMFPLYIFVIGIKPEFLELYQKNYIVIIGLPLAAFASLILVVFLEHTTGPLEFEGLGFKFRGASGPVILWVLCYLSFVLSFKILWKN